MMFLLCWSWKWKTWRNGWWKTVCYLRGPFPNHPSSCLKHLFWCKTNKEILQSSIEDFTKCTSSKLFKFEYSSLLEIKEASHCSKQSLCLDRLIRSITWSGHLIKMQSRQVWKLTHRWHHCTNDSFVPVLQLTFLFSCNTFCFIRWWQQFELRPCIAGKNEDLLFNAQARSNMSTGFSEFLLGKFPDFSMTFPDQKAEFPWPPVKKCPMFGYWAEKGTKLGYTISLASPTCKCSRILHIFSVGEVLTKICTHWEEKATKYHSLW